MIKKTYSSLGSALHNGRRRIGVLSGSLASVYQSSIVLGATDYARKHGYNVISFAGGPFSNPDPIAKARDRLFEVPRADFFDALIIPMGSLSRYIGAEEIAAFFARFGDIPIVNIGAGKVPGVCKLHVDSGAGIREVTRHFIVTHRFTRLAFISGPTTHDSSNEKLQAFRETLAEYGLPFSEDMVVHGDVNRNGNKWCVETLLGERGLLPQAIITVNDNQAFSIIEALRERGLRVPQDVAVSGCMGLPEGLFYEPALTTIREPTYELGWFAARALTEALDGAPLPAELVIPTEIVIRNSCGCSAAAEEHAETLPPPSARDLSLSDEVLGIAENAMHNLGAVVETSAITALAEALESASDDARMHEVLTKLEEALDANVRDEAIVAWLASMPALQKHLASLPARQQGGGSLDPFSERLARLLNRAMQKAFAYRHLESEKYVNTFRELSISLNASFNVEVIRKLVVRDIGITECYISVYEDKNNVAGLVRNILSIRAGQLLNIAPEQTVYPSAQLLPAGVDPYAEPYAFIVLPMLHRSEPIGFIVVNVCDRKGAVYENLQALISGALKTEFQIQELREAERKFSDIAHSTSDWLWEVDADCRYTYCSGGVVNVLGYTAEEMIGRSLFDFLLPSETAYVELVRNRLVPALQPLSNIENINIHKDGHEVTLLISGKPIIKEGRLAGYRGAFKDTTAIKQQENRIRMLAYSDTLTGLPNRTLFNDRLEMAMSAAQREHHAFAILFLDLDRFKFVNDTLGHDAGDMLLQAVARRLITCIRDIDTLARLGGDEFTIILSRIHGDDEAAMVARRIVAVLNSPTEIRGHQIFITTSIGIAVYPQDGQTSLALLKNADKAMYKAKEQGKNRFIFYDAQMEEKSNKRMLIEASLHKAIKNNAFDLHYQPQVDASTGQVIGVEALLRLPTSEFGAISPGEFITLAEEIGLIEEIGLWVFDSACRQAREWHDKGYDVRVAINVSARQLKNSTLAQAFINIINEHGVDPHKIEIEITENAVIDNETMAKAILDELSDFGITIAIDDFGTGYSSLSSLKKFPIDTVKIDRSFINDSIANSDSASIVNAIVQMARSLKLNVIAEGVETADQLNLLQGLGCPEIQGYLLSRPLPVAAVEEILRVGMLDVDRPGDLPSRLIDPPMEEPQPF